MENVNRVTFEQEENPEQDDDVDISISLQKRSTNPCRGDIGNLPGQSAEELFGCHYNECIPPYC